MRKTGLGRFIVRRVPASIAASPFEFFFVMAYAVAAGNYLVQIGLHGVTTLPPGFPIRGDLEIYFWAIFFAGAVLTDIGLVIGSHRPLIGLRVERAGLLSFGAMIVAYLAAVVDLVGFTINIGIATIVLELLAVAYRTTLIGQALDRIPREDT